MAHVLLMETCIWGTASSFYYGKDGGKAAAQGAAPVHTAFAAFHMLAMV